MLLGEIAHVRTGDKGDVSQIAVFVFDDVDYPLIERSVTCERVLAHLPALSARDCRRFALPQFGALNFVIAGALGGGVTRSLSLDAHGKTLGALLLDLAIDEGTP